VGQSHEFSQRGEREDGEEHDDAASTERKRERNERNIIHCMSER
jgi:hypothetical protein